MGKGEKNKGLICMVAEFSSSFPYPCATEYFTDQWTESKAVRGDMKGSSISRWHADVKQDLTGLSGVLGELSDIDGQGI